VTTRTADMSLAEFARRIGVSRTSAWRLATKRRVVTYNAGSGKRARMRVTEAAYQAFVASNRT
jgi:hypothetical protein